MKATHAGVVAFRRVSDRTLYLVVASSDGGDWVLPKGHIEQGEASATAALRELAEEAGVTGEIVARLPVQRFEKAEESVTVEYFLVRWLSATGAMERRAIRWEDSETSLQLLTFEDSREVMRSAICLAEDWLARNLDER